MSTTIENGCYEIIARVLRRTSVAPDDDYFSLGGTSLGVLQILWLIEERFGVTLSLTDFFDAVDLRGVANLVAARQAPRDDQG